ncbi:MAG: 2-phosphosulfolactate phosphatase [Candidatus Altiarchaeia archaeon]
MEIKIDHLLSGARSAKGLAVIIDVFRAATTAAYIMGNGADEIILAGSFPEAFSYKKSDPDCVLVGERHGLSVPGFDYGNSPYKASLADFTGKTVVMKTSSGTEGILAAKDAEEVLFACFVNASATVRRIKKDNPRIVSFVGMGWEGKKRTEEDELCAEYLNMLLSGGVPVFDGIKERLRRAESSQRFFSDKPEWSEKDFYYALDLDRFDYALKALEKGDKRILVKA